MRPLEIAVLVVMTLFVVIVEVALLGYAVIRQRRDGLPRPRLAKTDLRR